MQIKLRLPKISKNNVCLIRYKCFYFFWSVTKKWSSRIFLVPKFASQFVALTKVPSFYQGFNRIYCLFWTSEYQTIFAIDKKTKKLPHFLRYVRLIFITDWQSAIIKNTNSISIAAYQTVGSTLLGWVIWSSYIETVLSCNKNKDKT